MEIEQNRIKILVLLYVGVTCLKRREISFSLMNVIYFVIGIDRLIGEPRNDFGYNAINVCRCP